MLNTNTLKITALVSALAVASVVTADAQSADAGGEAKIVKAHERGQMTRRGGGMRRGGGEMFMNLFRQVDADSNREVTREEVDAFRAAKLAEVDSSGDGAVSIEEFDTFYREMTRARMVDAFQRMDEDGDGVISQAEMDTRIDNMFARMDRDGDGVLKLQRRQRDDN